MNKLMYVAMVPLLVLAAAMFARTAPNASASLSTRNSPAIDIQQMHRSMDLKALPNGNVDPVYLAK